MFAYLYCQQCLLTFIQSYFMSFDVRRGDAIKNTFGKLSSKKRWLTIIAIVAVIVLLYFFISLPGKPYLK
jgi:hypothetical protein